MLKWRVEYENFNGDMKQKDFYFNLTRTEIMDLIANDEFDPDEMKKAISEGDNKKVYNFIIKLIKLSYGIKSEDGEHFMKSPAILQDLMDCPAYDTLIMDVLSNDKKALNFFTGIFPKELLREVEKEVTKDFDRDLAAIEKVQIPKVVPIDNPHYLDDFSKEDLIAMIEKMKRGETEGVKTPS